MFILSLYLMSHMFLSLFLLKNVLIYCNGLIAFSSDYILWFLFPLLPLKYMLIFFCISCGCASILCCRLHVIDRHLGCCLGFAASLLYKSCKIKDYKQNLQRILGTNQNQMLHFLIKLLLRLFIENDILISSELHTCTNIMLRLFIT